MLFAPMLPPGAPAADLTKQAAPVVAIVVLAIVVVSVYAFAVVAIVKAFTRRTGGWIVAGSFGGLVPLTTWLGFVAVAFNAVKNGRNQPAPTTASDGGPTEPPAPRTATGRVLPYHLALPDGWYKAPNLTDFDLSAHRNNLYFGVIAEEGSLGTPENIAALARKRLNGKATEVEFAPPVPERIDGRAWVQFRARCRINDLPVTYQFHVYSGDEGTFQLVGWTSQDLYDRDEAKLRVIATSFRFPAPGSGGAPPNPAAAAPRVVRGHGMGYELRPPADWRDRPIQGDFDVLVAHGSLYVGVTAEEGSLGAPEVALNSAQGSLRGLAQNLEFGTATPVRIDGRDWLRFSAKCSVQNVPITYQYTVYAGPEGTFQIIGWTMQNLYDRDADRLGSVAGSFRFPSPGGTPIPGGPADAAGSTQAPQTVRGLDLAYQLTVPGGWKVKGKEGAFDQLATHHGVCVGVVAEEGSLGTPKAVVAFVQNNLRKKGTETKFGPSTPVKIDGRDWLEFTATCKLDGIPLAYQYYAYAGPEGTFRVTGWSAQNVAGRYADTLREAAVSFRFPPPAPPAPPVPGAVSTAPLPANPPKRSRR